MEWIVLSKESGRRWKSLARPKTPDSKGAVTLTQRGSVIVASFVHARFGGTKTILKQLTKNKMPPEGRFRFEKSR